MAWIKVIARSYAHYPDIDPDIVDLVRKCERCTLAAETPVKYMLYTRHPNSGLWARIRIVNAGPINSWCFLIVLDAHSKWSDVFPVIQASTFITVAMFFLSSMFSERTVVGSLVR